MSINEQKNQLKLKPWPVRVDKDRKLDLSDFIFFFLSDKKARIKDDEVEQPSLKRKCQLAFETKMWFLP